MHVVTREEMQAIDLYTIQTIGLGGPILMENAGQAIYDALAKTVKAGDQIVIVIGKGNNGGDGFVLSRLLLAEDRSVETWLLPDMEAIRGDARVHLHAFLESGGTIHQINSEPEHFATRLHEADVVVDALLGTGFHGVPRADYAQVIQQINASSAKIIAVDLPSGVPANGEPFSHEAVHAAQTLTLQCPKIAQFVQPAAGFFGKTEILSIGIPERAVQASGTQRELRTRADVRRSLPVREPFSNKGTHGKGLLIAGAPTMPGAAYFAARAALRSGIGLLTVSVPEEIRPILASLLPEVMYQPRQSLDYNKLSGLAIGPGLGRDRAQAAFVAQALDADIPTVIDADGLYHLAAMLERLAGRHAPIVLSPHPGEMARLTGQSIQSIESSRFSISRSFARKYGIYLVLKGRYTLITAPDGRQVVNPTGNAALAKGGSGDVLTGILLAYLLQHKQVMDAVCNAVYVHGALADTLVQTCHSPLDVLATDLIEQIPPVLHDLYKEKEARA
ncbi:NAD(P)H-hydrate dehydratase [Sporolactobacillus spathodeae]|uniref:Bifunctional NAD(P)H-hydrate repair enzyme n=1 Tax=Sporolactobacillus spathodeae TaxID=1465502 RepID=A0ABS2QAW5_9BACL|nr:NAD(P)H-hydrate epimerase [Sporolactobacillus spathodeae]